MSLYYGNTKIGSLYLGSDKIKEAYYGNVKVFGSGSSLAPYTMRFRFGRSDTDPTTVEWAIPYLAECWTKVESITDDNVWDFHDESSDWSGYFAGVFIDDGFEILDANLTGVTKINAMFTSSGIASISNFYTPDITECATLFANTQMSRYPKMDTSKVTDAHSMYADCIYLNYIPRLNTSRMTNVSQMFMGCTTVQGGILAMYEQLSGQANPPSSHNDTFRSCGSSTTTGAAELAQIPDDWK